MSQKVLNGLDLNSQTINNVADPLVDQDAATKAFSRNASNIDTGTIDPARLSLAESSFSGGNYPGWTEINDLYNRYFTLIEFMQGLGFEFPDNFSQR